MIIFSQVPCCPISALLITVRCPGISFFQIVFADKFVASFCFRQRLSKKPLFWLTLLLEIVHMVLPNNCLLQNFAFSYLFCNFCSRQCFYKSLSQATFLFTIFCSGQLLFQDFVLDYFFAYFLTFFLQFVVLDNFFANCRHWQLFLLQIMFSDTFWCAMCRCGSLCCVEKSRFEVRS